MGRRVKIQTQTFRSAQIGFNTSQEEGEGILMVLLSRSGARGGIQQLSEPLCHRRAHEDSWFLVLTRRSLPTAPWGWVLGEHPVACPPGPRCNIAGVA